MYPGSSQDSESDFQEEGFKKPKSNKKGKNTQLYPHHPYPNDPNPRSKTTCTGKSFYQTNNKSKRTTPTINNNTKLKYPTFLCTFSVVAPTTLTRVALALKWDEINSNNRVF